MESQIQSTLNVPLYLGLGGTFTGIIVGISGIVFNIDKLFTGAAGSSDPLRNLLVGVVVAMLASLLGLGLMTWNSSIEYKRALKLCDRDKNSYFDFIRRELMPSLSNSMAASLNSLKGVLGEFIGKFGRNLSDYSNSAGLLNDNIEKQHLLLVEINKMNQTQMATTIAKTFKDISDASEAFNTFKSYQDNLNNTVKNVDAAVSRIEDVADSFDDFAKALNVVVENQGAATELQAQFRAAIEQHFPIGSEAREMWRKEFDLLSSDATTVSNELNNQLRAATQYIRTFSENNKEIFSSMSKFKDVLDSLVKYSEVQASCYKDLKDEIKELKQVQIKNQADSAKLNADLLTAVREMIGAVKTLKD
jgi:methyl-accepting chemotaxis protein